MSEYHQSKLAKQYFLRFVSDHVVEELWFNLLIQGKKNDCIWICVHSALFS